LKEASYVHAEGYPVGELKHGPNALVSDSVPLVVVATVDRGLKASVLRYKKTLELLRDMKAQGAKVIAIANAGDAEVAGLVSDCVRVQPASEYLLPIVEVIPLQLFAYFMALERAWMWIGPKSLQSRRGKVAPSKGYSLAKTGVSRRFSGAKSHHAGEFGVEKFSTDIDSKRVKNNLQGLREIFPPCWRGVDSPARGI